jgi:hypothetical protein
MTIKVGDTVRYRTFDYEVSARVVRIDKVLGRLLVSWADGREREWIDANDVLYARGESVVVDGEVATVTRVDRDGDIDTTAGLHYRTHIDKTRT